MDGGRAARRVVHVLLGAVVLLPYLGIGWVLATTAARTGPVVVALLAVPAVLIGPAVLVLPGVRELAVTAARTLLDADLPPPAEPVGRSAGAGARLRAAAWLLLAMVIGAVGASALLYLIPVAVSLLLAPWVPLPPLPTGPDAWWAPPAGLALLPVAAAVPVVLGAGQARLAPSFLGPTPAERLAAQLALAHRRADRQAGRARLARELHDSVGHALTVSTLQAGAAAELLDRDPEFARRALQSIADTGRAALDDLDHVLGLLREDTAEDRGADAPVRDLAALDALVEGARAAGLELRAAIDPVTDVPAVVSREAYRLVQEGLTNALRHGGPGPVTLAVHRSRDALALRLGGPAGPGATRPGRGRDGGGRGLAGARERVALLGGELTAGPDGDAWVLHARLPAPATGPEGGTA